MISLNEPSKPEKSPDIEIPSNPCELPSSIEIKHEPSFDEDMKDVNSKDSSTTSEVASELPAVTKCYDC